MKADWLDEPNLMLEVQVSVANDEVHQWTIRSPGWLAFLIYLLVAVAGVLLVLYAWNLPPFNGPVQRTEDAYIQGHTTLLAPQVNGYVEKVAVNDFSSVKEGDLLFTIDSRRLKQAVAQSEANLDAKKAALANNKQKLAQTLADVDLQNAMIARAQASQVKAAADEVRSQRLVRTGSVSQSEDDAAVAALKEAAAEVAQAQAALQSSLQAVEAVRVNQQVLEADVEAANAQLSAAQIDLGYATITAPATGKLSEIGVRRGQYVVPGATLAYIVPAERWVIANFKEAQTRDMRPGQRAWFTVDALASTPVCAKVENIAPATGAQFSALKPDNATGNFTKVPQRIPVRIAIDEGEEQFARLGPGMSVVLYVDTSGGNGKCR